MGREYTLYSTDKLDKALEETQQATGRDKPSEVLFDGIELYDLIVLQIRQGKHIYIGNCRETAGELALPHLEHARKQSASSDDPPPKRKPKFKIIEGGKGKKS